MSSELANFLTAHAALTCRCILRSGIAGLVAVGPLRLLARERDRDDLLQHRMPRPFKKSGRAAIEKVSIVVRG